MKLKLWEVIFLIMFAIVIITIISLFTVYAIRSHEEIKAADIIEETALITIGEKNINDFDNSIINRLNRLRNVDFWSLDNNKFNKEENYDLYVSFGEISASFRRLSLKELSDKIDKIEKMKIIQSE